MACPHGRFGEEGGLGKMPTACEGAPDDADVVSIRYLEVPVGTPNICMSVNT